MFDVKAPRRHRPRLLFALPVLGWILRDLAEGGESALGWFLVAILAGAATMTLAFGLPGLVLGMLGLAALAMLGIVFVAKG